MGGQVAQEMEKHNRHANSCKEYKIKDLAPQMQIHTAKIFLINIT